MNKLNNNKYRSSKVPGIKKPVLYRKNSTDYETLKYIFYDRMFSLDEFDLDPKWIIDGGAYVGYTSVYFANEFPNAQIIAVEPDGPNFQLLKKNVRPYQNVVLEQSGLWNKDTYLQVKDVGLGEWGMVVEELNKQEPGAIKATTITSLINKYKINTIDILKLNIEGAEKELFSAGYEDWLNKVKILIIELHDRIKPGCSDALFKALEPYNFGSYKKGWNNILYNKNFLDHTVT
ncbi:hypothetical protein BTR23_13645 [Alkalihalophilus pseudofirmus]|nr:hypothetical protein BTR23_13645 [Alkalihalophilus pseudofirmus]